jgi:hypothetical protein
MHKPTPLPIQMSCLYLTITNTTTTGCFSSRPMPECWGVCGFTHPTGPVVLQGLAWAKRPGTASLATGKLIFSVRWQRDPFRSGNTCLAQGDCTATGDMFRTSWTQTQLCLALPHKSVAALIHTDLIRESSVHELRRMKAQWDIYALSTSQFLLFKPTHCI